MSAEGHAGRMKLIYITEPITGPRKERHRELRKQCRARREDST